MLYIVLAYLMLFAALSNTVCLYIFFFFGGPFIYATAFFMFCLDPLTHSLFISCDYLHHAQWF